MTMNELRPGEHAVVREMHNSGPMRRRLRDLGLIEGTAVTCLGLSPLGDPAAYAVRGAAIALRDADSQTIEVEA
jgi:ferrous iron transport protein A